MNQKMYQNMYHEMYSPADGMNPYIEADRLFDSPLAQAMMDEHIHTAQPILEPQRGPRSLKAISSEEIVCGSYTPPPFVVEEMLPAGLTMFAAPPKTGKSWLCMELAHCVATGRPFWGRATCAGSVLYMDLESRDYRVQARMGKAGLTGAPGLRFAFEAERLDTGLLPQLSEHLAAHPDLKLVIVDTLARVKGGTRQKADAYVTDTMTLAPLQSWALNHGIAVLCVTHMRKQGVVRTDSDPFEQITGSNAQFGVADGAWLITGARDDKERRFIASGRDYESVELTIAFEREHCRWRCMGDTLDQERRRYETSPVVRTIRDLLSESEGACVRITANDLLTAIIQRYGIVGFTPTTLSKHLKSLEHDLLVRSHILYMPPQSGGRSGRMHEFSPAA